MIAIFAYAFALAVAIFVAKTPTADFDLTPPEGVFDLRFVFGLAGLLGSILGAVSCVSDLSKELFNGKFEVGRVSIDLIGLAATGISAGVLVEYVASVLAVSDFSTLMDGLWTQLTR